MTDQIWRSPVGLASVFAAMSVAACATPDFHQTPDPCALPAGQTFVATGTAELGVGDDFTAVTTGQSVDVVQGSQSLHMFVVNLRVQGLEVDDLNRPGGVDATVLDASAMPLAADYGCRTRAFTEHTNGWAYAGGPYQVPVTDDVLARIDGTAVMLRVEVHDAAGHQAIDTRSVMAHVVP